MYLFIYNLKNGNTLISIWPTFYSSFWINTVAKGPNVPDINLKPAQLSYKTVSSSYWNYEVEDELWEKGLIDFKFKIPADREMAVERIDQIRAH